MFLKKEMGGLIRAKLLITHFIIVKVNTVCENRGTFSSFPQTKRDSCCYEQIHYSLSLAGSLRKGHYEIWPLSQEPEQTLSWSTYNGKTMGTMASNSNRLGRTDF